jgi:hypothetical protein
MIGDISGNIFLAGNEIIPTTGTFQLVTFKYSSAGVPLWTNRCGEPNWRSHHRHAMAINQRGELFVTDAATVAYDGTGMPLWTNSYYGETNTFQHGNAVALGTNGNIFVAGGDYHYATIAYSPSGLPLWTNVFGQPGFTQSPEEMVVNKDGVVVVSGNSQASTNHYGPFEVVTLAYTQDGVPMWTNRYLAPQPWTGPLAGLATVPDGGVVILVSEFNNQLAVIKYSISGVGLWTNRYSSSLPWSYPRSLATGSDGSVYIAGATRSARTGQDFLTLAYAADGVPVWTNIFSLTANSADEAKTVAIDGSGNVIVAGLASSGAFDGSATIAYARNGAPLWTNYWSDGSPTALVAGDSGSFVILIDYLNLIKYELSVPLSIQPGVGGPVLSWINSGFGWTNLPLQLQSALALEGPFTNVPGATSPYMSDVPAGQKFFRLVPALQ